MPGTSSALGDVVLHTPAAIFAVQGGPNPQERPDGMKRKQTNPPCRVNSIGMRMVTLFGHIIRDVMNGDDSVKKNQKYKNQYAQRKIVEKNILLT